MKTKSYSTYDLVAISSSLLCALHCAAAPILLSFSALGSVGFLENPYIEYAFIAIALLLARVSLYPAYKRIHHNKKPITIVLFGFLLILISRIPVPGLWEPINTVLGACLVSISHFVNWKLSKNSHQH